MARLPRLSVPGYPYHVIQRGNNHQTIFSGAADRQILLDLLHETATKSGVAVHAYVLMDNHYHLLVTPQSAESLPQMMQSLGRRYVRHFNDRLGRSGTLWEGRYKSGLIQTDRYLLACMVYMDLNPVRAGMVADPRAYPWSSHAHYCGLRIDPVVTPHPLVWELGNTPFARESRYVELVEAGVSMQQQADLTAAAASGWPLGDADFVTGLQRTTERRLTKAPVGRPVGSRAR